MTHPVSQSPESLALVLQEIEERASKATPGPWHYEQGGGHAYNRIMGAESVQTNGWPERINGVGNASYTDRICENLGDTDLPYPAANVAFIAASRTDVPRLVKALRRAVEHLNWELANDPGLRRLRGNELLAILMGAGDGLPVSQKHSDLEKKEP